MKFAAVVAVMLIAVLAVVSSQRVKVQVRPVPAVRYPPVANRGDRFSASLAGAQVGTYSRTKNSGGAVNGWRYRNSEVSGESLGNAKVGIYGNDRKPRRHPLRG